LTLIAKYSILENMKVRNYEIFELHAEFCKTMAHPKRLIIVTALENREMTVGEFVELLNMPIANVSQHLKALRDHDIVTTRKDGQKVYYSLTDKRLNEACDLIREIIASLYKRKGKMMDLENIIEKT
jgi:ArsR family transcriptional regulator